MTSKPGTVVLLKILPQQLRGLPDETHGKGEQRGSANANNKLPAPIPLADLRQEDEVLMNEVGEAHGRKHHDGTQREPDNGQDQVQKDAGEDAVGHATLQ